MPEDTEKTAEEPEDLEPEEPAKPSIAAKKARPAARTRAKAVPPPEEVEDDDDLPPPSSRPSGGSGAVWAFVAALIVLLLLGGVWWKVESERSAARKQKARDMEILSSQLGTVQDRINKALHEFDQPTPDVDRAIEALNGAAENMGSLTSSATPVDPDLAGQLLKIQGAVRAAAQGLAADKAMCDEKIKAARADLSASAARRVQPLTTDLQAISANLSGGPEMPLRRTKPGATTPAPAAAPVVPAPAPTTTVAPAAAEPAAAPAPVAPAPAAGPAPVAAPVTAPAPAAPAPGR